MTIDKEALYLGNTNSEDCGFTVGKKYKIYDFEDGYIGSYDDNDTYRYIKNGAFHNFKIHDEGEDLVNEAECSGVDFAGDKKMKAIFKGYKNKEYVAAGFKVGAVCRLAEFTVGSAYLLNETEGSDYFRVVDDAGIEVVLNTNGSFYYFEPTPEDKPLTCSELFDDAAYGYDVIVNGTSNKPQIEKKRFTYYINGMSVNKEWFDSALSCVKDFEDEGVDASSIKFELKFE